MSDAHTPIPTDDAFDLPRGTDDGAPDDLTASPDPAETEVEAGVADPDGAAQAADLSRKHDFRANHAWALRLLGMLHAEPTHGDETEARGFFLDGLSLAQELGMRPLQAHCHLGLGTLYRRAGRVDEARAELTTAVAMLSEMGMAFWLPEAERELAAVTE